MTAYIGIDPGQSGGLAVITATGILSDVVPMPAIDNEVNGRALGQMITAWQRDIQDRVMVVVEDVHSMPKQGVASTFKFGKSYGIVLGVVAALGLPSDKVRPQDWKKSFTLIGKDKDASRLKATELWPSMSEHWKYKYQNGKSDAALIAEHARRRTL